MHTIKRNRPTIGVLAGWNTYPGSIHSFLEYVYSGITSAAYKYDCNLLIGCGAASPFNSNLYSAMPLIGIDEVDFIPVGPWNTDGLIVIGPFVNQKLDTYFQGLIDTGFPIVYCGDREVGPSVKVNNEDGIYQAVSHLIDHGHQKIAFSSNRGDQPDKA